MKAEGGLGAREIGTVGTGIVTGDWSNENMLFPCMECHNEVHPFVQLINAEIKKKQVNKIHSIASWDLSFSESRNSVRLIWWDAKEIDQWKVNVKN